MNAGAAHPSLRPLSVGEVLDRAVSLVVKHFVVLATIFIVYAIPLGVAQYFVGLEFTAVLTKLQATLGAGAASGKPADPAALARVFRSMPTDGWYPAYAIGVFVIGPLPGGAIIAAASALYLGGPATFALAYRAALGRWSKLIAINVLYGLSFIALYAIVVVVAVLLAAGIALVTVAFKALGIAIAIGLGLAVVVAGLAFSIAATLAWQVSLFTCVVEKVGAVAAFRVGLRRVFAGVGLRRSLLVGFAFLTILVGIQLVSVIGAATIVAVVHNVAIASAYGTLVRVATAAFTTAFVAIFYFDLRVREEGLDLQFDAARARLLAVPTV